MTYYDFSVEVCGCVILLIMRFELSIFNIPYEVDLLQKNMYKLPDLKFYSLFSINYIYEAGFF